MMVNGQTFVGNSLLVQNVEVHRRPRKWAARVRYQRERAFDYVYEQRPSRELFVVGDLVFAHPLLIEEISRALDAQENRSERK